MCVCVQRGRRIRKERQSKKKRHERRRRRRKRKGTNRSLKRIVTFVMRLLRPGYRLRVLLPPLDLRGDLPRRHRRCGRRPGRHRRRPAHRRQIPRNYQLHLRLLPRLGDDVVNLAEALALQGPAVPLDHLVTWNRRMSGRFLLDLASGWAGVEGQGRRDLFTSDRASPCRTANATEVYRWILRICKQGGGGCPGFCREKLLTR